MKVIIVVLAFVALVAAAPVDVREPVKILSYENDKRDNGYAYRFASEDGTSRDEEGVIKEFLDEENKTHQVVIVRGSYTYINNEGKEETITYEADQNGFRAFGDSIPKQVSRR